MRSNPLTLGNKKLAAATNLMFEEGVVRTRYGFHYKSLGADGQFQGACEYRPKEGLSAVVHSEADSGIAVVAGGVLWFNCNPISVEIFERKGAVHIYQAENYLILQNPSSDTYWWDGSGELVQSPGMNEVDWNDPEVPVHKLEMDVPVADLTGCGVPTESKINARFLVIDHVTEIPVPGAVWSIEHNDQVVYDGVADDDGRFAINPTPRDYTYTISKSGYTTITDEPVSITGTVVNRPWSECSDLVRPTEIIGEYDFVVRLKPLGEYEVTDIANHADTGNDDATFGVFTLTNTGDVNMTLNEVLCIVPVFTYWRELNGNALTSGTAPLTLEPGDYVTVEVRESGDVPAHVPDPDPLSWAGTEFTVVTAENPPTTHTWAETDTL